MKITECRLIFNELIAENTFLLRFEGDCGQLRGGQFVNIKLPDKYLLRPISIADYFECVLTIVVKVVGEGTHTLCRLPINTELSILCGLGNGFVIQKTVAPLLVGGGVGTPPLLMLAKELCSAGIKPTVVLGFGSADEIFFEKELGEFSKAVIVTTTDGSYGQKGLVTDAIAKLCFDYFYACGPTPMLKALEHLDQDGQISTEQRMGCGFGACMGCSCKTKGGYARVCVEGPVFKKGELIW